LRIAAVRYGKCARVIIHQNENFSLKTNSFQRRQTRRQRSTPEDGSALVQFPERKSGIGNQSSKPVPQKIIVPEPRTTLSRGLRRTEASAYIGISPSKFDELVQDGRMPPPKRIDGRKVWDIRQLDLFFDKLPGGSDDDDKNPWDEALS
jgi:predicted DNA-binding transcriptional regulator AlpA